MGESASVSIDTKRTALVGSLPVAWDASWIGGNARATVVIEDNGVEVKRVTGSGEFVHDLSGAGRHLLTYATYLNGSEQGERYQTTVYRDGTPTPGGDMACFAESATVAIDTNAGSVLSEESLPVAWDASWIGGNARATVVIEDNGVEVKRVTGSGEFVHDLSGAGRHLLTYATYLNGSEQGERYQTTVYRDGTPTPGGDMACFAESATVAIDTNAGSVLSEESLPVAWDASWIGGNARATVVIEDNGMEVKRATGIGDFLYLPETSGRHLLTYATILAGARQEECYQVVVYRMGAGGWTPIGPLPELPAEATPEEVQAAVAEFADAAVIEHIKTVEDYNAFKAWVGKASLEPEHVAEAPRAWASYVLGQPALLPEEIPEDTLLVESFEPDASAGDGAYSLTFRLEDATLGEEAVAALLDTVFEVQGGTSLAGDGLSGDAVETTFEVVDGKVRVKVSPKGDTPPGTFFYRIRLK